MIPSLPAELQDGLSVRQRLENREHMQPRAIIFRARMLLKKYHGASTRPIDPYDLAWLIEQAEANCDT